jgi:hypothetical protein
MVHTARSTKTVTLAGFASSFAGGVSRAADPSCRSGVSFTPVRAFFPELSTYAKMRHPAGFRAACPPPATLS